MGLTAARELLRQGREVWIEYRERSFRNQLSRASKLGASWCLILGEDEAASGTYQLKDMATGEQREMTLEGVLRRFGIHPNVSPEPRDCCLYAKVR